MDRFATRTFVIVAEQMQNAVDEQRLDLFIEGMATALRLTSCGLNRDDDISEKVWL